MRQSAFVFAAALFLSGCYGDTDTPLAHAILALKDGDAAAFAAAKDEAEAAAKTAWQPGMDVCKIVPQDLQKAGEAALIEHLDHPELFQLSEEERFVYAVKVAGEYDAGPKAGNTSAAAQQLMGHSNRPHACNDKTDQLSFIAGGMEGMGETQRVAAFQEWCDAFKDKYPDDAQFDAAMRDAASKLNNRGFAADWPEKLEFVDDSEASQSFLDEQKRLGIKRPGCRA